MFPYSILVTFPENNSEYALGENQKKGKIIQTQKKNMTELSFSLKNRF